MLASALHFPAFEHLRSTRLQALFSHASFEVGPPPQGSPGPFGPGTPEESKKVRRGGTPRVRKDCTPESQKSPKRVQKSGFRLFSDSFESLGALLRDSGGPTTGALSGLFSDSSGVLGPQGPGDPVQGGADPNVSFGTHFHAAVLSQFGPLIHPTAVQTYAGDADAV